ncbi:MAG: hypothetical protein HOD26_20565 [Gammaproteobacteria bacterium]|nr:hypothetical protein [Gammaproteobacteria bacterium]
MADLLTAADESVALEDLHTKGFTDGLPVIIPTPARVSRMVLATGLEADMVLGTMGPGHGIATIEKVAVAAVMAGCLPDYMPVVLAAVKAVIDPVFDLTEMQATTHCTAPLIIVNGPARHNCGPISSSYGALGPGHRANASIGRALRLAMINIGGGRPGTSDMALLGHPGKFTFCLAEDEENSPFPPMHVDLGFDPDDSVVTVIGAEAPHSVLYSGDGDDPNSYKSLLDMLAIGIANAATNNAILTGGTATIVLNPEHAEVLNKAGLTRQDTAEEIHRRSTMAETAINKLSPGFAGKRSGNRDAFKDPEQLLILMSGGSGLYSMVMPSWCAGPHKNSASCIKVESEFFCEVPGLANQVI